MTQRSAAGGMGLFTLIWLGQLVSALGSGLTGFALGVRVFQSTGSVTRLVLIGLAMFLPTVLLSPWAGVLADRWDRRHLLIFSNVGSAVSTLGLYWLIKADLLVEWHIYVVVGVNAAFVVFVWPTLTAATTLIVGKEHFGRASGMNQMGISLSRMLAPVLAGVLLMTIGLRGVILIDFATFLFSTVVLLLVRFPQPEVTAEGRAATGTLRWQMGFVWTFIRERPGLLQLLLLFAAVNSIVTIVPVLVVPLVLGFASPVTLGLVLSFSSCGMLVGGIVMSVWGGAPPHQRIPTILGIVLCQGVLLVVSGLRPSATLIAFVTFFFMVSFPLMAGISQTIWQSKVPPDIQGRVFAVRRMLAGSTVPLAMAGVGPLADYLFEPLLRAGGPLADSVGQLIGVGPGRGIALLLMVLGILIQVPMVAGLRSRSLLRMEETIPDAVTVPATRGPADGAAGPGEDEGKPAAFASRLRPVHVAVIALFLVLGAVGAISSERRTPEPMDAAAASTEFSAERALGHLAVIARRPHPVGSPAHQEVRGYLVARLEELGLETRIQRVESVVYRRRLTEAATVYNVVARLPGNHRGGDRRRAVLLVGHYDSAPTSPGASANGAAVATMLETARALGAGEPLANDVIFLFSDAKEIGLHGARAFVRHHPWAREVEWVLNLEARGHGGPVYLVEIGAGNSGSVPHLIAGAPQPAASSMLSEIYRRFSHQTDFTVFREAGYAGFHLVFLDGLSHYHNMLDRPQAVEAGTVQHQGSYALGLARYFGDSDLGGSGPRDRRLSPRSFFHLPGSGMVHYPKAVAIASAVLAVLLFPAVVWLGLRRRRLSPFGLWQGFLASLGMLVGIPVTVTLIWYLARDLLGVPVVMESTQGAFRYMIAFTALTWAAAAWFYRFFRRVTGFMDMAVGALIWWVLLAILTSGLWLPAESNFLVVWPLVFGLAAVGTLCLVPAGAERPWRTVAVLALGALPAVLLVAPFIATSYVAFQGLSQLGGVALVLEVLLIGLLIPQLEAMTSHRFPWLPVAAVVIGCAFLAVAIWNPDEESPSRQNSVLYALDADSDERFWLSFDDVPDAWTRQFGFVRGFTGSVDRFSALPERALMTSTAPEVEVPQPALEGIEQRDVGDQREYRLRLRSDLRSRARLIWFEPPEAMISARLGDAVVSLRSAGSAEAPVLMRLPTTLPEEEMILRVQGRQPVTMTVVEQYEGLPEVPGIEPRSGETMPRPFMTIVRSDVTLVRRSFTLPVEPEPLKPPQL
ncbi:MAG: MFS transporter [bacterium]|nr:MFS transporter [bacterium]